MKTRQECFEILRKMKDEGLTDDKLKIDDIIAEKDGSILVRNCLLHNCGTMYLPLHSYQIWANKADYTNQNHGDCNNITCLNIATEDEEGVIKDFARFVQRKSQKVSVKYSDTSCPFCPVCGSGEYMTNEDGNNNDYCGQCGTHLDWDNMVNVDEED